jgi:hypothetical protein
MSWLRPPASRRQRVREEKHTQHNTTHVCTPKANCKAAALTAAIITNEAGSWKLHQSAGETERFGEQKGGWYRGS